MLRRWAPWSLLAGLGVVTAVAIAIGVSIGHSPAPPTPAAPATQSVAPPAGSAYRDVAWTSLKYPGLNCSYISQGNVKHPGSIVIEQVTQVHVTGRSTPLALVVVSCNLNHVYANLYAFTPGPDPRQPMLVQRLALFQGSEQLALLSVAPNRVSMKLAGNTGHEGLCCPSVVSVIRWIWTGRKFDELPPVAVTSIIMPDLVGLRLEQADQDLGRLGIVFMNVYARANGANSGQQSIVVRQSPKAGDILHPPNFLVSLTTR